jgi:hypothetical protein
MALAGLTMTAAATSADPITITSGFVTVGGFARGSFRSTSVSLTSGDSFVLNVGNSDGPSQPVPPCSQFAPCTAGATTTASRDFSLGNAVGSGTLDGTAYSTVLIRGSNFSFTSGDVVLPDTTEDAFDLSSPFLFQGMASIWTVGSSNTPTFFGDVSLIGHGTATTHLERFGTGYAVSGFTYEFANDTASPTPEPASMLLLGTGLVAAWQSRRLRRPQ